MAISVTETWLYVNIMTIISHLRNHKLQSVPAQYIWAPRAG